MGNASRPSRPSRKANRNFAGCMVQRVERDREARSHWDSGPAVTVDLFGTFDRRRDHDRLAAGAESAQPVSDPSRNARSASAGASVVGEQPAEALARIAVALRFVLDSQ